MKIIKVIILSVLPLGIYGAADSSSLSMADTLDYAQQFTGYSPQASLYLAETALGSHPNLLLSVGRLAPYAPGYMYYNSDYYTKD